MQDTHVRYAPLYVTRFPLNAPGRQPETIDNVPDRLRWLRHSRGLLQKEVAQIAGISRSAYTDLETGRRRMTARTADRLAAFFGVPPADLTDDSR